MIISSLTLNRFWRPKTHSTPVKLSYHASTLAFHDYRFRKLTQLLCLQPGISWSHCEFQVAYIKALDIWLTFSQALIFLVLLEYSFVSFYITKRVFDCIHRRAYNHHRLLSQGQNKSPPPVSVRLANFLNEIFSRESSDKGEWSRLCYFFQDNRCRIQV